MSLVFAQFCVSAKLDGLYSLLGTWSSDCHRSNSGIKEDQAAIRGAVSHALVCDSTSARQRRVTIGAKMATSLASDWMEAID
jgi:hypothetical protein